MLFGLEKYSHDSKFLRSLFVLLGYKFCWVADKSKVVMDTFLMEFMH
jgi:hypothetical protein